MALGLGKVRRNRSQNYELLQLFSQDCGGFHGGVGWPPWPNQDSLARIKDESKYGASSNPNIRRSPARRRFVSKSGAAPRSIQITPAYISFLCQNNQYGTGQRCNGGFASVCHVKLVYQVSGIHSRAVGVPDNRGLIGMEKIWSPNARLINKRTNR